MKWWCVLIQRWLPDYPDGELSSFWRRRLDAHLQVCPGCRQELEELRRVMQTYREHPLPAPAADFWESFNRELHLKLVRIDQPAPEPRRSRLPYLLGAPALALLFLFLAGYGFKLNSPWAPGRLAELPRAEQPLAPAGGPRLDLAQEQPPLPGPETARILEAEGEQTLLVYLKNGGNGLAAEQVIYAGLDDGVWAEEFPSWDVDAVVADLSRHERQVLVERLSSRR